MASWNLFPGTVLHGFCEGYFGRHYGTKTVIAAGLDDHKLWIVAREEDGVLLLAQDVPQDRIPAWLEETDGD